MMANQKLSVKVMRVMLAFLFLAVLSIGLTLYWSWQLQGSAAAINEAGSLRMHSYRLALSLQILYEGADSDLKRQQDAHQKVALELEAIEKTFSLLKTGDPQRPLFLPPSIPIQTKLAQLQSVWKMGFLPIVASSLQDQSSRDNWRNTSVKLDAFVEQINQFVKVIEDDNERRNFWVRTSQLSLLSLAVLSTCIMIYMLFVLIIQPVERLQLAMQQVKKQDLSVRVPVESQDEFGELSMGFNQMAQELEALYTHLEKRVQQKTTELAKQNRELALLYDCAAFLQKPQVIEELCSGFLTRIQTFFAAQAGSVRIVDPQDDNLYLLAHSNFPEHLANTEHCLKVDDCLCAQAVYQTAAVVHQLDGVHSAHLLACQEYGFKTVSAFHIHVYQDYLGMFNLYFTQQRLFMPHEKVMLDTLGQLLGVAIQNMRLATQARELARLEERNLVAQGLHDSIAQGLTFLNIQMQLLNDSLINERMDQVDDVAAALQAGIQEIYDDVRELLLNFRSRLADAGLYQAIHVVVEKFRKQTGITVELESSGQGSPLPREQQLQILFIVQEALSNIRKHADAERVVIKILDGRDFEVMISDNGEGFDMADLSQQTESHIGLHIMQERASSIQAELNIESIEGQGTCVRLYLPEEHRHAA